MEAKPTKISHTIIDQINEQKNDQKNRCYGLLLLMFLSMTFLSANAQKVDPDSLINKIKSAVASFFVDERYLKMEKANANPNAVFATELVGKNSLGYNKNGIYRIGVFQSHAREHVLIKEDHIFKIYDIQEIDETLKDVIEYCKRNKIDVGKMFSYIRVIMDMYDMNYKIIPNSAGKLRTVNEYVYPDSRTDSAKRN
ncbi:hypothetical protein Q4E93_31755 [Flavitalea sp. BT771]|uniref:hypothetical protein n=1 Tax=Flavitalea sp. BT771 TaxID=3063329 RepID=UPI0026E27313|nr:hypothetical protein [Flavitalea sp. BT771]MDO6435235.1 hypothetical protein [Flavitalea sp. BT771]MDV6224060.1 hypothetical protein [Flavitalea sp. BT771]